MQICSRREGYELPNFIMDTIYGSLITIVPIVVVTTLNILLGRRLRHARNVAMRLQRVCAEESRLRLEFTGILLIVSTTFISTVLLHDLW